jgi:hypothetical protein
MNEEILIPMAAISFLFLTPLIIICTTAYLDFRKKNRMFNTIDKAIERGVEIPTLLLEAIDKPKRKASSLQRGLIWCGLGLGVLVAWTTYRNFNEASLGFIPLFIGIAYLILARLEPAQNDE